MTKCPQCFDLILETADVCRNCGAALKINRTSSIIGPEESENAVTRILNDKLMTPEKWQKIKSILESVQAAKPEDRDKFLADACGADKDLRSEVEKLLESYEEEDGFLEHSAVAEVASMFDAGAVSGETGKSDAGKGRFAPGSILDSRYKILRLLGKGGMGEVYLANDSKLDRDVALKVLPSDLTESKKRLQRFEQEARAVSALNHPHILTIFEFGKGADGVHFIATEFVDGKTLHEHGSYENLSLSRVLDIAMQTTSALAAAHEAGITHRDIKPDNIMVRHDGYIKILDFGLAKLTEPGQVREADSEATTKALVDTAPGSVMGTAAYMSPEQARGLPVDERTDIWSVGVVLYELITGRKPFKGDTSTDTIISVIKNEPVPILNYVPDLPSEVEWVVSKTLSKEVDGRYQTAKELHADLAKIKKRVDFASEKEAANSFDPDGEEPVSRTINLERMPTDADEAGKTNEMTKGSDSAVITKHELSLEYAVTKAATHKGKTAIVSIAIVAAILAGVYFTFLADKTRSRLHQLPLKSRSPRQICAPE